MKKTAPDHSSLGGSNRLLPLADAAALLAVEPPKLRREWRRWGIVAFKVGRELRFREQDINAWLARHEATSMGESDLAATIVAEVDKAPPLTEQQKNRLALLLGINPDARAGASS